MLIAFAFSLKEFLFVCLFTYRSLVLVRLFTQLLFLFFLPENHSVSSNSLRVQEPWASLTSILHTISFIGVLSGNYWKIHFHLPYIFCILFFSFFCYYVLFTFQKYLYFMRINSYCCHTFLFYLECPWGI